MKTSPGPVCDIRGGLSVMFTNQRTVALIVNLLYQSSKQYAKEQNKSLRHFFAHFQHVGHTICPPAVSLYKPGTEGLIHQFRLVSPEDQYLASEFTKVLTGLKNSLPFILLSEIKVKTDPLV